MKRFVGALALVAALFMAGCASNPAGSPPAQTKITIVHTNDIHARAVENKAELGYTRIGTIVKQIRAENPNTLVLDAGDTFHGLPFANLERGASIAKLMNAVGYDYMTTGNHDYNYGQDRLLELSKEIKFPILAANVYKDGKRLFKPYAIRKIAGVKIGIFGLATPETYYKTDPKNIVGITFADPIEEARKMVAELDPKTDIIICLSHIGMDKSSNPRSVDIAKAVPGIDVIIDGHSHSSLETCIAENDSRTLIASAGEYGRAVGVVDILVGPDHKIEMREARSITAANSPDLVGDPEIKAVVDGIVAAQKPLLSEKVGATSVLLLGLRDNVRTSQTNLGTLIANGMISATGADVALTNGGGIRDSIAAGDITKGDIFRVMPFGNYIVTIQVTGADIVAALENGVGKLPASDGRFPHVAGMTYTLDVSKPAGSRISDVKVKGAPIDLAKTYVLASNNFTAAGGDEYNMFKGRKLVNEYPSDAEVFMAYLRKIGTVTDTNL
jgi:5'-nucleotidase / UDP-sugar diphosphatase